MLDRHRKAPALLAAAASLLLCLVALPATSGNANAFLYTALLAISLALLARCMSSKT